MVLKEIFDNAENGVLTYEQFAELSKGAKFVDLNEGNYVSKSKYEDAVASRDEQINTLNEAISSRDTDLEDLKNKLAEAGTDASKLSTLTGEFEALQGRYNEDIKSYKDQLKKQAYEFAVSEYANKLQFTSDAAKRDFKRSMIDKELKYDSGTIIGADDFKTLYANDNPDAFKVEDTAQVDMSQSFQQPKPQFVSPTQGADVSDTDPTGGFASAFHFTGIRSIPQED